MPSVCPEQSSLLSKNALRILFSMSEYVLGYKQLLWSMWGQERKNLNLIHICGTQDYTECESPKESGHLDPWEEKQSLWMNKSDGVGQTEHHDKEDVEKPDSDSMLPGCSWSNRSALLPTILHPTCCGGSLWFRKEGGYGLTLQNGWGHHWAGAAELCWENSIDTKSPNGNPRPCKNPEILNK